MRKIYSMILTALIILSCNNNNQGLLSNDNKSVVDSLKKVLKITDSIAVLYNHHYSDSAFDFTLIDYNVIQTMKIGEEIILN